MIGKLLKILKRRMTLIIVVVVASTLFGGGFYVTYLKHKLTTYVKAVDVLASSVETTDRENHKLRQENIRLDKLLTLRSKEYQQVYKDLNSRDKTREDLKREDKEAREYYSNSVPESVRNRMQQW